MKHNTKHIKEIVLALINQSKLTPPCLKEEIKKLNQAQLENLMIILDLAVRAESKMTKSQKEHFTKLLQSFFEKKKRIYQKTIQKFQKHQEAKFESQEQVLENLLIQQIQS